jgi:tRNA nucleotidyltransferase/poly(A) polymerase/nicotinamide mononucleotide adenylyltransferase
MKLAVFIGKFSPIHKDHLRSMISIKEWADKNDAQVRVYSTISTDEDKQPLPFERKLRYIKAALEPHGIEVSEEPVTDIWKIVKSCAFDVDHSTGDKGLYLFTGSDHESQYKSLLKSVFSKYEAKGKFTDIDRAVMPTVGRVNGVGISATSLRNAAKSGDYESFASMSAMPTEELTREMFDEYATALRESTLFKMIMSRQLREDASNYKELAEEVVSTIKEAHPEAEVYYIGGTARDFVAGIDCNDIDIAVNLSKNQLLEIFSDVVSANRFGDGYIVIINYKGQKFDLDAVIDKPIEEKIIKGDLTFNCMAYDPLTGEVIDPEDGQTDLKNHTLRFSKYVFELLKRGAEARSVLRPFKFQARWGWDFDDDTIQAIKDFVASNKFNFNRVSRHNMQKIWDAIKSGPHAKKAFKNIRELGLYDLLMGYQDKMNREKTDDVATTIAFNESTTSRLFNKILREAHIEGSVSDAEKTAIEMIKKIKGLGNKAYVVGGAARDKLMGKSPNDIDLITDMSSGFLKKIFEGNIANTLWRNGHEVIVCTVNGEDFEVSRIGRSSSLEKELEVRDLTMNAIAWDPTTDEYIDPTGGIEDIKNELLEFTPENTKLVSNGQQPARVLRLIRFYATTGFMIGDRTRDALTSYTQNTKGKLGVDSSKNFMNNWNKLTKGKNAKAALRLIEELGFADEIKTKFGVDW